MIYCSINFVSENINPKYKEDFNEDNIIHILKNKNNKYTVLVYNTTNIHYLVYIFTHSGEKTEDILNYDFFEYDLDFQSINKGNYKQVKSTFIDMLHK